MSDFDHAPSEQALSDGPVLPGFEPAATPAVPYRVLARKYRPQTFDDLIGQESMVRTLSNAFAAGRIPQAWILTGVRGVGKTTTARILARGLNYQTAAGGGGPTVVMPMDFLRLPLSALLGYWLYNEGLDAWSLAGGALILAANTINIVKASRA